jgi:hypothetical protein
MSWGVTDYHEALEWESEDEEVIRRFRKVYVMVSSTFIASVCV